MSSNTGGVIAAALTAIIVSTALRLIFLAIGAYVVLINVQDINSVGFNFWNIFWIVAVMGIIISPPRSGSSSS